MNLKVLSLTGVLYEGEAKSLNVKTTAGEITVLDHHRPLVSPLAEGTAHAETAEGLKEFKIKSGFLHVEPDNSVTLLTE